MLSEMERGNSGTIVCKLMVDDAGEIISKFYRTLLYNTDTDFSSTENRQ